MSPPPAGRGFDRGFPEHRPRLPGKGAKRPGRRPFGTSWWGQAWVDALEGRARLDPNRLPRGRAYARTGAVGTLSLAPGEIQAEVQGSRARPYTVRVRIRRFEEDEWERVLDALAAEIGHTAALLEGELPPEVADDAARVGLDLLPGPGELQPRCSCPDWADPCKHAAAVCYLVADALDGDPFGVFLLRGRDRDALLAGLRARRRGSEDPAPPLVGDEEGADEGVLARDAWSAATTQTPRTDDPLPAGLPPPLPRQPGRPTVLSADPPPASGLEGSALRALAADAAGRALALARGGHTSGLELSAAEDLARRAALALSGTEGPELAALARRGGIPNRALLARALAWRDWGPEGLAVLDEALDPGPGALAAGRRLLGPGATVRRNRVTLADRQVRLGRDGVWYPLRKDRSGQWLPDGPALVAPGDEAEDGTGVGELFGDR